MSDGGYIVLFLAIGGFFAVHCTRATVREWRTGKALGGRYGDYERESSPLGFWVIMFGNAAAAIMGALFFLFGVFYLFAYLGWIK